VLLPLRHETKPPKRIGLEALTEPSLYELLRADIS